MQRRAIIFSKSFDLEETWIFPTYFENIGDNSEENARNFVERQFERCMKDKTRFYHFATTATDTKNIEYVRFSDLFGLNLRF